MHMLWGLFYIRCSMLDALCSVFDDTLLGGWLLVYNYDSEMEIGRAHV